MHAIGKVVIGYGNNYGYAVSINRKHPKGQRFYMVSIYRARLIRDLLEQSHVRCQTRLWDDGIALVYEP